MKKLLALILSVVMVCSIATTASATEITDDSDIKTASGEIVYNLETGYCIEIPEQINALTGSYTFSAYYVSLSDDEQVVVRISGVDEVSHLVLTNDIGDSLTFNVMYPIQKNEKPYGKMVGWTGNLNEPHSDRLRKCRCLTG